MSWEQAARGGDIPLYTRYPSRRSRAFPECNSGRPFRRSCRKTPALYGQRVRYISRETGLKARGVSHPPVEEGATVSAVTITVQPLVQKWADQRFRTVG